MVSPYFAQRKLPTEVGAAKLDYPSFHAGREQAAIAEFARVFGATGVLAEKRMNAIVQTEYTSGKADWETAHVLFEEGLREDPDHANYVNKYKTYSKKVQKDILTKAKSPESKRALSQLFEQLTPSVLKSIGNVAWARKSAAMWGEELLNLRKFELAGNSPAAHASLVEAVSAGIVKADVAAARGLQIDHNIDWNNGYRLTESDPEGLLAILDKGVFEHLDAQDIEQLRTKAESTLAANSRLDALRLTELQKATGRQRLADLWDNKLTDPQVITNDLRNNALSLENAKYLRDAMLNPDPPKTNILAYAEVLKVIDKVGIGTKTISQAMDVITKNVGSLDPTTGKGLVKDIFGEHNKARAKTKSTSNYLMKELIRDKDKITGVYTDNAMQILGEAEAIIEFNNSLKDYINRGKPLVGDEILIEAMRIGINKKRELNVKLTKPGKEPAEVPGFLYTNPSFYGELLGALGELPKDEQGKAIKGDIKKESAARTRIYDMWNSFSLPTQDKIIQGYKMGKPLTEIMKDKDVAAEIKKAIAPPKGLEAIWGKLTKEEKATARTYIRQNVSPEHIVDWFNRNE